MKTRVPLGSGLDILHPRHVLWAVNKLVYNDGCVLFPLGIVCCNRCAMGIFRRGEFLVVWSERCAR